MMTINRKHSLPLILTSLTLLSPVSSLTDREILNSLYTSTNGDTWKRSEGWTDPDNSICDWEGITCTEDEEHVFAILLSDNKIRGTIPMTKLLQLPHLTALKLSDNDDLEFPTEIVEEDVFEENKQSIVSKLRRITLNECNMETIDGVFGKADGTGTKVSFPDLISLHLENTSLKGTIPQQIFQLTGLTELDLSDNGFDGPLPEELTNLKQLKTLDLSYCYFEGDIPDWIGQLNQLEYLDLSELSLDGTLNEALNELTNLKTLALDDCELGGPLITFDKLTKLEDLDLSDNFFTGSIPTNFLAGVNPDVFIAVDLSDNELTGVVPTAPFAKLDADTFFIADNKISGIEPSLCQSSAAGGFGCNGILCAPGMHAKQGNADENFGDCRVCPSSADYYGTSDCDGDDDDDDDDEDDAFKFFDDDDNDVESLSDEDDDDDDESSIDEGDDSIKEWHEKNVSSSDEKAILLNFYETCNGKFWYHNINWGDSDICSYYGIKCVSGQQSVEVIEISRNNVNCVNPTGLFNLPNLKKLSIYGNDITISFQGIQNAKKLEELYIDNTFTTTVDGIENAPSTLKRLSLNNCRFSSTSFPTTLLELTNLEHLSLSSNHLFGPLPRDLDRLTHLETLILKNNRFEGHLDNLPLPSNLRMIDLSKNNLDGSIPDDFLISVIQQREQHNTIEVDLSENSLTGIVPVTLARRFDGALFNIDLRDNYIDGMDPMICDMRLWNDGAVGLYGCDGLMCPRGTSAPHGKRTVDEDWVAEGETKEEIKKRREVGKCHYCRDAFHYGNSKCYYEVISGGMARRGGIVWMLVGGLFCWILMVS